jgi:hypothetical protein
MNEDEIVGATVKLVKARTDLSGQTTGGQGVLIPGSMILTAAHCLDFSRVGPIMLENEYVVGIVTSRREKIRGTPIFIDLVSDVAVIGMPTNDDRYKFEAFCKGTMPAQLSAIRPELRREFPVRIRTHTGKWIEGFGRFGSDRRDRIHIKSNEPILGGTSGSPVVDKYDKLLGIVSTGSEDQKFCSIPFARRTLPAWVLDWTDDKRRRKLIDDAKKAISVKQSSTMTLGARVGSDVGIV